MSEVNTYKTHDRNCICLKCVVTLAAVEAADEIERLHYECERLAKRNALLVVEIEELKSDCEWACKIREQLAVALRSAQAELAAYEQQEDDQ